MSRKKKTRAKQAKTRTPEELKQAAPAHLQQDHFKDAADAYKQLLKTERRTEWVDGLAQAYAGRAQQLAARGMVKEAIALWQNRAETCDMPLADPRYLQWLIAAERSMEIARLYRQDAAALAGPDGITALRARLAAAALANDGKLIRELPADDPVAHDFAPANAALQAYAQGDDETLQSVLSQIAFRSPYRDLRQLLKALSRYDDDPAGAAQLCARIPVDTPFSGLRRALMAAFPLRTQATADATTLAQLANGVQDTLAALLGWHGRQHKLVKPLAQLGTHPSRKALFEFVLKQRKAMDADYARYAAFMLADNSYATHRRLAKVHQGQAETETYRLLALTSEVDGDLQDAVDMWHQVLHAMSVTASTQPDERLRRALVHRHVASLMQPKTAPLPLDADVIEHMQASLELDPSDPACLFQLIDHYRHVDDLKSARYWVDQALAQYPDDTECLFKAAETAVAGKALKKATRYAKRILAIDPINANARGLLVDAHLGHARKQITVFKEDTARREIAHAARYARSNIDVTRVALNDALTTFACDSAKAARPALQAAVERADEALVGRFLLLHEAYRSARDLDSVARAARLPALTTLGGREHVLALIDTLGTLRPEQRHQPAVEAALNKLVPALNAVAKADFNRGRAEHICETLLRYRQYAPLKRYANTALKRWPKDPLFTFYWAMGSIANHYFDPRGRECDLMERAFQNAEAAGDTRTAQRIGSKLDELIPIPAFGANPFGPPAPPDDAFDHDDADMQALRDFIEAALSPNELARMEAAMEQGDPPPDDIMAKLDAMLGAGFGTPPAKQRGPNKNKRRPPKNDAQGDLFGDDE